ncbi:MAG TPA: 6-phosphogluconolactonase [Actinocrinis sp.]|uniref:6-phosphogluconolactonase n=1 Tax=Actinocrinis sp. TaxID=1920516 RepID=UPI002DDD1053|nr:6-phosphogluconolactonase [Actinocrinis sp.]HEV3168693.1 6-phosphogluconolactonase [Actinocrinis sp.]
MTVRGATPELIVHRDAPLLAAAVAARLVTKLVDVLAAKDEAHLVLTGGTVGIGSLAAVAELPARVAVDWRRVHLWWGDERFLPAGDKERNDTQARDALLDQLDLDPDRVHAMPATDGPDGANAEAAAERYAAELARHAPHGADVPEFDLSLFGMGPDGHIASLFPEHPGVYEEGPSVIAVHNSPKPPPNRLSLTFRAIEGSREVWVVAAGAEKAAAAHMALSGAGRVQVPAAGALGRVRTLWLLDRACASELPPGLNRIASP